MVRPGAAVDEEDPLLLGPTKNDWFGSTCGPLGREVGVEAGKTGGETRLTLAGGSGGEGAGEGVNAPNAAEGSPLGSSEETGAATFGPVGAAETCDGGEDACG